MFRKRNAPRDKSVRRPDSRSTQLPNECAGSGCGSSRNRRDYVLDLDTLWRLAWAGGDGRMERATPAASRRQRGSTYRLPDLPASSGALLRRDAARLAEPMRGGSRGSECSARPEAARIQARSSARSAGRPGTVRRASSSSRIAAVAAMPAGVAIGSRPSASVRSRPWTTASTTRLATNSSRRIRA